MDIIIYITITLAVLVLLALAVFRKRKTSGITTPLPDIYKKILEEEVEFYKQLDPAKKQEFGNRVQAFLSQTRITGVNASVENIDRVLIAASAIIPIFGFPDWEYINLNEILLYPGSFNHDFDQTGDNRPILGMVGDGAFNDSMILSQHELRQAFLNKSRKTNTAIHEFVHLLDKTDGSVDGIPESILSRQYILPWLRLMRRNMQQIMANRSDINPYGATNEGEFFAVVSEYFFERPDLLQSKHPDLYDLLTTLFQQKPARLTTNDS